MRFAVMALGLLLVSQAVLARGSGDKAGFMAFCTAKQSEKYCQCTMDFAFDAARAQLLEHERRKVADREDQLAKARERSLGLDPAMTVERLNSFCDISDEFHDAKEAYYFNLTGYKDPPQTDMHQREHVAALQDDAVAKMNVLHARYGSNETTVSHVNTVGGGTCMQRRELANEKMLFEAYVEKDKAGDVKVPYRNVYGVGARNPESGCQGLFAQ